MWKRKWICGCGARRFSPCSSGTISINQGEVHVFGTKYTINRGDIRFLIHVDRWRHRHRILVADAAIEAYLVPKTCTSP